LDGTVVDTTVLAASCQAQHCLAWCELGWLTEEWLYRRRWRKAENDILEVDLELQDVDEDPEREGEDLVEGVGNALRTHHQQCQELHLNPSFRPRESALQGPVAAQEVRCTGNTSTPNAREAVISSVRKGLKLWDKFDRSYGWSSTAI
jgi:hypothetical protein